MKILIPRRIVDQMKRNLELAGHREIGGILMAEHLDRNAFRISEITVQHPGTVFNFVRRLGNAIKALNSFFNRTAHQYPRFNYLGEWHSHPMFNLEPSQQDEETMLDILLDDHVGANFVVLLLVHLRDNDLQASATVYMPNLASFKAITILEE